jgi:hypothetical protein
MGARARQAVPVDVPLGPSATLIREGGTAAAGDRRAPALAGQPAHWAVPRRLPEKPLAGVTVWVTSGTLLPAPLRRQGEAEGARVRRRGFRLAAELLMGSVVDAGMPRA